MKYWLLTTEYPPFYGGGIGTYCAVTSSIMADEGHDVSVFVNDDTVSTIRVEKKTERLKIIRFNPSQTKSSALLGHVTNISYEFAHVVKLFIEREGKPDIIESQEYLGISYYLLQYKYLLYDWCAGIPVIITIHSPSFLYMEYNHVPEYKYPNYWICEMERFCLQAADLLIFPSNFIFNELRKRFELNNQNIKIIPNPVQLTQLDNENADRDNHAGEIIFFGKLTVQKGAFHLLNYFDELWKNGFEKPLFILASNDIVYHPEGKTMGDIIKKKYRHYIDKGLLKLEGTIKPVDIPNRLSRAQLVIIPSVNDNLPYAVFEMMSLGKIVLVSKQGGQSEVVENNIDGFIFDHETPGSFSMELKTILELTNDKRKVISQHARQKISSVYSPKVIYEKKYSAIKEILSDPLSKNEFPFIRLHDELKVSSPGRGHQKGLLSIVIPYYNMGNYIDETLQSVASSNYNQTEIIIVNDGSTDLHSLKKLDQYREQKNIKIIDTGNRGLSHARNAGAEAAAGEFLAFLDADDKVDSMYYSRAVTVLSNYPNVHFAGSWSKYFGDSGKNWAAFTPEPPIILYHNTINSSSLVYKRQTFLDHGKNDTTMTFQGMEDYESVIALIAAGYKAVVFPEFLFYYRVRSNSMIRDISKTKKIILCQYIANKHKKFYGSFAADIFGLMTANGSGVFLDNPSLDYHLAEKIPLAGSLSRKLIRLIKRNKFTRKIAYKIYRLLNK